MTATLPVSSSVRARARGLIGLAVVALLAFLATYGFFVRTPFGQRWDDRAYLGSLIADLHTRQMLTSLLQEIRISTLVLMTILLLVIGILRRRFLAAGLAAAAFAGAILTAEIFKRVLHRPNLAPDLNDLINENNIDTFPSGHATIAMAFALGLLLVSSPRARPWIAIFSMAWSAGIAMAASAASWHRPSDLAGGIALAACWMGAAAALSVRWRGRQVSAVDPLPRLVTEGIVVFACAMACLALWTWRGSLSAAPVGGAVLAFLLAEGLIAMLAIVTVLAFAWLLRDTSLDPAPAPDQLRAAAGP